MLNNKKLSRLLVQDFPRFSKFDHLSGFHEAISCGNLLRLIIHDIESGEYEKKENVRKYIYNSIINIINNNAEPSFVNSHNWGYSFLAQSIVLIRNTESLWNMFSEEEKERIEWIMKMFLLMWTFGCNLHNSYSTGISLKGNFTKKSGPNYQLVNNFMIVWTAAFFKAYRGPNSNFRAGLHRGNLFIEHEADYDFVINKLKEFNWNNAYNAWTTPGFKLENGEDAPGSRELYGTREDALTEKRINAFIEKDGNINFVGSGRGCRILYYYKLNDNKILDNSLNFPNDIISDILDFTFSGGLCQSFIKIENEENFIAGIKNGLLSPYENKEGLMREFNIPDDGLGMRSSLFHCDIDFILVASSLRTLKLLNFDFLNIDKGKIYTGMDDCLFKLKEGYNGYSMGNIEFYNSPKEFDIWKEIWEDRII